MYFMEKVQICNVYITPSSCVSLTKNIEHYLTRMSINGKQFTYIN